MAHAILVGTVVFFLLGTFLFAGLAFYLRGRVKDEEELAMSRRVAAVGVAVGATCMWLVWVSTYLHQMHPLIYPILAGG